MVPGEASKLMTQMRRGASHMRELHAGILAAAQQAP
jgi:hypothetical protein